MKKMILFVAILTLAVFVSGVMAQTKPAEKPAAPPAEKAKVEKPKMEKFAGMIDKVDEMGKAIDVKGKVKKEDKTMTFGTTADTKITRGKDTLAFADLKKGMDIAVEYKKDGDKMIAATIKVAAPKAAPKKEKPAEAPKK
jgi:hypothetical protein